MADLILPPLSTFDCEREGVALYYTYLGSDDTASWFFVNKETGEIRWSSGNEETTNFISNCIVDEIIAEEKAVNAYWKNLSEQERIDLMKTATSLSNPTAVALWSTPPEAVRQYLDKHPELWKEQ